jgi:hypothetical protein
MDVDEALFWLDNYEKGRLLPESIKFVKVAREALKFLKMYADPDKVRDVISHMTTHLMGLRIWFASMTPR